MESPDARSLPFVQYGAGGHGKVVRDAVQSAGLLIDIVADDDEAIREFGGMQVLHPRLGRGGFPTRFQFIVAIGDNRERADVFNRLLAGGGGARTVAHRSAVVSGTSQIGLGSLVCAGVVVNPAALVGQNCILNTCCSVDHDCVVADHVHLCPGVRLGGNVAVGEGTMIGLGAVVLPGIRVGSWSVIGAGSVVNRDIPDRVVAYGNPARVRRKLEHRPQTTDYRTVEEHR